MLISQAGTSVPSPGESTLATPKSTAEMALPQVAQHVAHNTRPRVSNEDAQDPKNLDSAALSAKVKEAVDIANSFMNALAQNLEFSIDKDTNKTVVKVIDTSTKEVVKQFPTQEMLDIAKALDRLQGVLHKTKA